MVEAKAEERRHHILYLDAIDKATTTNQIHKEKGTTNMERLNEKQTARKFVADLLAGKYGRMREPNDMTGKSADMTEQEHDVRDTSAVRDFGRSATFEGFAAM